MTYPVLKRPQIFVDIDRRHIAYWTSRENGISKVSPPPQRAAIHIYVSEVQSRQGAISHLRLLHGPKWLRVLALPIGVAFSSNLGPEKISSELDDRQGPGTQVRREGTSCRVSHLQTTLSQDTLANFVTEDVVAGLEEELPLLRHAISGALSDTNEWTRTNLLWTNTFSYV